MDLNFLIQYGALALLVAGGVFALLRRIYRPSTISATDPLNVHSLIVSCYTAGFLVALYVAEERGAFLKEGALLALFFAVSAFASRLGGAAAAPMGLSGLKINRKTQLLFSALLLGLLLANLVVNYFFGTIPLLKGTDARSEMGATPIPSLVALYPFWGNVAFLLLVMGRDRAVKALNRGSFAVYLVTALLSGAKSSIFIIVILLTQYDYLLHLKERRAEPAQREQIRKAMLRCRRFLKGSILLVSVLLPFYLQLVKFGDSAGTSLMLFGRRLFGGFDGLIFTGMNNIDFGGVEKIHLAEMYLYPIVKKFFYLPEFQSAGEYVIYLITKNYDFVKSGLNPNSNLILELLLAYNFAVATALLALVTFVLFRYRVRLISKGELKLYDVIMFVCVVMAPFRLLVDGAYFVNTLYQLLLFYLLFNTLNNLFDMLIRGRLRYEFY